MEMGCQVRKICCKGREMDCKVRYTWVAKLGNEWLSGDGWHN
jgi:hypothetical protein